MIEDLYTRKRADNMTLREHFAGLALHALLTSGLTAETETITIGRAAVAIADDLLDNLHDRTPRERDPLILELRDSLEIALNHIRGHEPAVVESTQYRHALELLNRADGN